MLYGGRMYVATDYIFFAATELSQRGDADKTGQVGSRENTATGVDTGQR